jgi:hypothetical protein
MEVLQWCIFMRCMTKHPNVSKMYWQNAFGYAKVLSCLGKVWQSKWTEINKNVKSMNNMTNNVDH